MNLLDESIIESQRQELCDHHISARQIGVDVGWKGMKDGDIIRLLHESSLATFFTRDDDFCTRRLCHQGLGWPKRLRASCLRDSVRCTELKQCFCFGCVACCFPYRGR